MVLQDENNVKVYSTEEIDLFLTGDRRDVDKFLLHGINNVARVLMPHIANEEKIFESLGSVAEIAKRRRWIDAEIRKKEVTAEFYEDLRTELGKKSAWVVLLVVAAVVIFWWNGHTPDVMHIPNPIGK